MNPIVTEIRADATLPATVHQSTHSPHHLFSVPAPDVTQSADGFLHGATSDCCCRSWWCPMCQAERTRHEHEQLQCLLANYDSLCVATLDFDLKLFSNPASAWRFAQSRVLVELAMWNLAMAVDQPFRFYSAIHVASPDAMPSYRIALELPSLDENLLQAAWSFASLKDEGRRRPLGSASTESMELGNPLRERIEHAADIILAPTSIPSWMPAGAPRGVGQLIPACHPPIGICEIIDGYDPATCQGSGQATWCGEVYLRDVEFIHVVSKLGLALKTPVVKTSSAGDGIKAIASVLDCDLDYVRQRYFADSGSLQQQTCCETDAVWF